MDLVLLVGLREQFDLKDRDIVCLRGPLPGSLVTLFTGPTKNTSPLKHFVVIL